CLVNYQTCVYCVFFNCRIDIAELHLYGQDMDANTTAVEASLGWAIARSRRAGGGKEGDCRSLWPGGG
ncbi:MAG: hypothetical protein L0322_03990, partial [Chloroflexi bacterium]|nr:hypothetical protein [Chloroflexota bacterium]